MTALIRFARLAGVVPTWLASAALMAMMVMTFADVLLRSVLNAPIEAATELTRILMAIVVFSVLPVVSGRSEHIAVDLMDPVFGKRAGRWRDAGLSLACGAMLWWPAERVVVLARRAGDYGDITEYLGIPQTYIAWFIAVMVYMTSVILITRGVILCVTPNLLDKPDD